MKKRVAVSRFLPWLAAAAGLATGWGLGKWPGEARGQAVPMAGKSLPRGDALTRGQGSAMLADWGARVEDTPDAALPELAVELAQDGRRHDPALWMPLIARWSVADAAGMIAFLAEDAPPALRDRLLDAGWFAWGAVDPEAAFAAGRALPQERMRRLLEGVAEVDPAKAAGFVTRVPDSQFAAWSIGEKIFREAPDAAADLMKRAVYDGARGSFERAKIVQLAETDPAAAIAYARSLGAIASDPVPQAVVAIAKQDPAQAAAEVEAMASSRSKALSVVALSKTWVTRDADAALAWVRGQPEGPVRQAALVAAAGTMIAEPERALALVEEAGWTREGDFHGVRVGSLMPSESRETRDPMKVVADALRNWSASDPEAARRYLGDAVPEAMREKVAVEAGIEP
jgi:hypothetical protein